MSAFAVPRALRRRSPNALLVLVCLAQLMVILDVSIVNVALPSIKGGLHFSTTGLQWVVNAYTLTFAGFLLLGGRAADLLGRRRVFLAGTALFSFASLVCALADSSSMLVGARALQGVGGAVISPASLAIITTSFREQRERNRALGIWGAMGGVGGALGALLGGVLTQSLGWPAIFVVNVPIGLLVLLLAPALVPEGRSEADHKHFDVLGATLVTGALTALVYGIVRTDTLGWGSPGVLAPLLAGLVLLGLFVLVEGRFARAPLVPLPIFRMPALRAANVIVFLLYSAVFAMWFFLSLYVQQVLGHDALSTGLSFVPMTLSVVLATSFAPRLVQRFGTRAVIAVGMLLSAAGLLLLTGVRPGGSYLAQVLPGGVLSALGLGLALVPSTIAAVSGVPGSQSGLASGLLNTSRLIGGALGLAALSTIAASQTRAGAHAGASGLAALSSGFQLAFGVAAAVSLLGALLAVLLLRSAPRSARSASALRDVHQAPVGEPVERPERRPAPVDQWAGSPSAVNVATYSPGSPRARAATRMPSR
ncbi:MAG TPA: MFS transporter [Solirubrobacteraceae bacterium]|jgi:EmrB/QacA subfamily drug resistance transporter|nr:MFS transporter [Solirubrobacteraceae bacterium]